MGRRLPRTAYRSTAYRVEARGLACRAQGNGVRVLPGARRVVGVGLITRFADHGPQQVSLTLRLTEAGPTGQACTLYVPVECYATPAEAAGELHAGEAILIAGKLTWTSWTDKRGEKRTSVCVLAWLVKRLAPAAVEAAV